MARVAPRVPEETDLLCEKCGYVLNGLPPDGRCPECGTPVVESVGNHRLAPNWEQPAAGPSGGFLKTTIDVIFATKKFYRTFTTRGSLQSARRFARLHWWIAAALFALTAYFHSTWYWFDIVNNGSRATQTSIERLVMWMILPVTTIIVYLFLDGITRLAAWLTNWEGTYRGYRLPYEVVLRGMYYHAAHYLPVALIAAMTVIGYQMLLKREMVSPSSAIPYLYTLSAEVVVAAFYLFETYWVGMRNMMYANK